MASTRPPNTSSRAFEETRPRITREESLKRHLKHVAMCAPMLAVGGVRLATGTGLGILVPIAGCVLMMGLMMGAMGMLGRGGQHGGG